MLWRCVSDTRYRPHLAERFGSGKTTARGGVWLHAVSVGEVVSAASLIVQLKARVPMATIHVSVGTVAGREIAEQRLKHLADSLFYAPFDLVWIVRRVLRRLRPEVLVVLETEIWPNLWREAKRAGAAMVVVNGRISDRALPRYSRFRWFFSQVLPLADRIFVQTAQDGERYRALGAANVIAAGNLKYDFTPPQAPPADIAEWIARCGAKRVWIAASTMPPAFDGDVDEDDAVLDAFAQLQDTLLILVPRRPERFAEAARKLTSRGIDFVLRTWLEPRTAPVLLVDSMGELASLFPLADVVFMGGTLNHRGGHNILEPAFCGKPVICGPHMENFAEIAREFTAAGAIKRITEVSELADAVRDPGDIGERARQLAETKRGATAKAVDEILLARDAAQPRVLPSPLAPLTWAWRASVSIDRALTSPKRLPKPVISVGGLAMGGTGKTPFVLWLARQFHCRVGILTRGYKRAERRPVVLRAGDLAPVDLTGDEAQIYLRSGVADVGIGADRYETGRLMDVDVFLLDDGFQHWNLARDLDIVLIDALDPTAGGVFPAGRLREDFDALARADQVVLTRAEPGRAYRQFIGALHCRPRPNGWEPVPPPERVAAFCGIGNPQSFRQTLSQLQIQPLSFQTFPDHHVFERGELDALLRDSGADALVTTEKDFVKLPKGLPVHCLRIDLEVDEPETLFELIRRRTGLAVG